LVSAPFRAELGGSRKGAEVLFAKAALRRRSIPNLMGRKHAQPVSQPVSGVLLSIVPPFELSQTRTRYDAERARRRRDPGSRATPRLRGHVAVSDLADYGLELPGSSEAYNSVGGLVFAGLGRMPHRGDAITSGSYSIRVESVRENRIESVRVRERRPAPPGEAVRHDGSGA
jgi:hypothetical protein